MSTSSKDVDALCRRLSLGKDRDLQEHAVRAALRRLLVEGRRGVVLADEVGFGKTYEALAVTALLAERARQAGEPFERVLVLCKSSLLRKWQEELSPAHKKGRGFLQYLTGPTWPADHPFREILRPIVIERRKSADDKRAMREDGRLQARPGIYIVNQETLTERNRDSRPFLRRLYATCWDLIIVDEAHHYARWTQPAFLFAPDGKIDHYEQGIANNGSPKILALTATPFELTPREMVQLLALVRADKYDLKMIEHGLSKYVRQLDQFFSLRERSPDDPRRRAAVARLRALRVEDALGGEGAGVGLQDLLRRYLIRNTKAQNERRHFLVNKVAKGYDCQPFEKLSDLGRIVAKAPLLPFEGPDALFYLELRELIEQTNQLGRDGEGKRTFITTDLRQGLSSYPQIETSSLLAKDIEAAGRLKALVQSWNHGKSRRLHPKVKALVDVVESIAKTELDKIEKKVDKDRPVWVSKVLVFSKLIHGTAPHLREELEQRLEPVFADALARRLKARGWGTRERFAERVRKHIGEAFVRARETMSRKWPRSSRVPEEFEHPHFVELRRKNPEGTLLDAYWTRLFRRPEQTLFLLWCTQDIEAASDAALRERVESQVTGPLAESLSRIAQDYLSGSAKDDEEREHRLEQAERECVVLLEELHGVDLVGRYDGANAADRESHRRNFNQPFNPFVLLVSRVGEEGIDLQEQCRYVIHYDLEWNPAKMEQREGRVDRVRWGRTEEGYIDVRFKLLKGTYEERIFHTVMQREQWFQVLIGAKRKELGEADSDETAALPGDSDEGDVDDREETGRLTEEEKRDVMMDLRP